MRFTRAMASYMEIQVVAVVLRALVEDLDVLFRVEHRNRFRRLLPAVVGAERDVRLAGAPAFRGDHHDAVRAARAVDRGGGGILQDVDRLDLVRVDAGDGGDILAAHAELREVLLDDRNAVDDVERLVAGVDRRGSSHADGDAVAGVARVLHHLDARGLPLERGIDACHGSVRDVRCRNGRDRAADVLAARCAVADHDDLGECTRHRDEPEVGRGGRTRGDGHAYVAGREPDALRANR
jgi:hypothetical protein